MFIFSLKVMLMMIMENLCAVDIKCYTAEPGQRELPRLVHEAGGL